MERSEGTFVCPGCFQKYEVPETSVQVIVEHLRVHEIVHDARWVRRHLREKRVA